MKLKLSSLQLQWQIVNALASRQLAEDTFRNPLGAIWTILEPLLQVAIILGIRLLISVRGGQGLMMNPVLFYTAGFVVFNYFLRSSMAALSGVKRSRQFASLLRIRPLDVLMATIWLRMQTYGTILVIVISVISYLNWHIEVDDPGAAVALFILVAILALGIGLSALIVGHRFPIVKLMISLVLRRVLFWTSALFFPSATLPDALRTVMTWNPLLHGIELFRHALTQTYPIPGISLYYFLGWTFGAVGLSLLVYANNEDLLVEDSPSVS